MRDMLVSTDAAGGTCFVWGHENVLFSEPPEEHGGRQEASKGVSDKPGEAPDNTRLIAIGALAAKLAENANSTPAYSDLGQTPDSNTTLSHYQANGGEAVLYLGDLSYADTYEPNDQRRWDTWARFVERSAAYQPWLWTAGNHELELDEEHGETAPFKPFTHRYPTPYLASGSTAPLWYSVKLASAHVVVLSSYSAYGKYTPQWKWLKAELRRVDRSTTPWLVVLVHAPWYSSNGAHYMEGETMRVQFESWLVEAKADLVLAGHVHAYERSRRVANVDYDVVNGSRCTPVHNQNAPVYVTVGDGGNREGIAGEWNGDAPPSYSAFRESSFGHATLDIKNRTHAYFAWHRNQDGDKVVADSVWLTNRFWTHTPDGAK
ncbi:hypothetical protein ACP70R_044338 [Stipagrostis hirtigluma subsp. patula]